MLTPNRAGKGAGGSVSTGNRLAHSRAGRAFSGRACPSQPHPCTMSVQVHMMLRTGVLLNPPAPDTRATSQSTAVQGNQQQALAMAPASRVYLLTLGPARRGVVRRCDPYGWIC